MSRTKKFVVNSFAAASYYLVTMVAGFILPRYMLLYYGSELNGLVTSISQFISYISLIEAGLSSAAIYALYEPLANSDYKKISRIVSTAKTTYQKTGILFLALTIALSFFYPLFVQTELLSNFDVGLLVLILSFSGVLEFFTLAKYRVILAADQRQYVISFASIIQVTVNTLIVVFLASARVDILILRIVALSSIILRSIILYIYSKVNYRYIDYKEPTQMGLLSKRWDALYLNILGAVQAGAPIIILTLIVRNLKIVSVFTIFNMIVGGVNGILSIFISGLHASFGEVIAKEEGDTLKNAYAEFELSYYILITIAYSVAYVVIMPFVRIYTASIIDVNYDLPLVGFLFVLNGLLYNLKTPQGMLVISAGMFRETRRQTTIQAIILIFAGSTLGYFWGLPGIMIGSILSNLYRCIDLASFVPRQITRTKVRQTAGRMIRVFITTIIISAPSYYIHLNVTNYLSWAGLSVIVGIISALITMSQNFFFDYNSTMAIFKRVSRILTKN